MNTLVLGLIVGSIFGATFGVFAMALICCAGKGDKDDN